MSRACKNKRLNPQQRKLAEAYFDTAMKIASKYCRDRDLIHHLDDVKASAWMGLVDAAFLFDELRGVKFATYLTHRVLGQIIEDIRRPTRAKCRKANVSSLDEMNERDGEHDDDCFGYWPDDQLRHEDESEVSRLLSRFMLHERFAYRMVHGHGYTMKQVGKMIGLSESRVSQILSSMQDRLEASHVE